MKKQMKLATLLMSSILICTMGGCGKKAETSSDKANSDKKTENVVADETFDGTLVRFSGKSLTLETEKKEYAFDVSKAKINATNMVAGDEIVIIYSGRISGTDTSETTISAVEDKGQKATEQKQKKAVGTLVALTENTITIKQNDGTELTFNSSNCQHEFKNGIREGNWIVVTYKGNIDGTDTKNVKVIKITDQDENTIKKEKKQMNIKAVNETVYATSGVHVRKSYSTDSDVVGSLAKGASAVRTGICDNGWSRIQYNNTDAYVYGDYLTTTAPKAEAPPAKTTGAPTPAPQQGNEPAPVPEKPKPAVKQLEATGVVTEVSMNTISVTIDGQTYTLSVMDAEHNYANGIQTGNTITFTYTGDLSNNPTIIKVTDADPNTAAQNSEFTGSIIDATMNTVTIQTEDGTEMTFATEDASNNVGNLANGVIVKVTSDLSASDASSNIAVALQIDAV